MTKRYVEITIALDEDPGVNPDGLLEVSTREKLDADPWSEPSETTLIVPHFWVKRPWVKVEVTKED